MIRTYSDPVLRSRATPVGIFDEALAARGEDMAKIMIEAGDIGLAAPQIGRAERLIAVLFPEGPRLLANPEIAERSAETATRREACLSLPGLEADVTRAGAIRVRYQDLGGAPRELEADGLLAVCLQHEIDHLDGILYPDRLSRLRRDLLLRRARKAADRT